MSKVISVFNREAVGIYNTIAMVMELQIVDIIDKTTGGFSNEDTKLFILQLINSINKKLVNMSVLYSTIEDPDNPEHFLMKLLLNK